MKRRITGSLIMVIGMLAAGMFTNASAQRRGFEGRSYRGGYARGGGYRYSGSYTRGYAGVYRNNYYYHGGYANVYHSSPFIYRGGYSSFFGPRYYGVPHGSLSLTFGGNPYYYYGGTFYRPFGGYYRSVFPPVGLQIGILPPGYLPFYMGGNPYYFYNGTYYRRYNNGYEVVDAPLGAKISNLPQGAKSVSVNGEQFYELNGTYYKEDRDARGSTVYTVVGKNGEINNTEAGPENEPQAPKVGDTVSQLPANTKTITLNGETLYVSPDDIYYRSEGNGTYTVVGVAGSATNPNNSGNSF